MKKILTLTSFVVLSLVTLFYVSCSNEETTNLEPEQLSLRDSFINGQTLPEQKASFKNLSDIDKTNLWIEKLDQLKKLDLPTEHLNLINELHSELKNNGYIENQKKSKLTDITQSLFKITPAEDLKNMFFDLKDYSYSGKFNDSSGYITFNDINNNLKSNSSSSSKRPVEECTCRWTCEDTGHSNCTETSWGCGLLWLWSCEKRLT